MVEVKADALGASLQGFEEEDRLQSNFWAKASVLPRPSTSSWDRQDSGDLVLNWTRRSRQGFAWVEGIDAPLGEAHEQYRVNLNGATGSREMSTPQPSLTIVAADVAALGGGNQ